MIGRGQVLVLSGAFRYNQDRRKAFIIQRRRRFSVLSARKQTTPVSRDTAVRRARDIVDVFQGVRLAVVQTRGTGLAT